MQEFPSAQDRRLVFKLLRHWRNARGDALYPPLKAVYAQPFDEILPCTFELAVGEPGSEPLFRRIGLELQAGLESPLEGRPVSAAPPSSLLAHAIQPWIQALRRGLPISVGSDFVDAAGRTILFRTIVMPVSDDGVTIDALLGGANCKVQEAHLVSAPPATAVDVVGGGLGEFAR